ncbi:regulatory protein, luxR family [Flavobacteriaceae bacterium MAR_2010_188]|nr:regulatory protein, luxR family [Flavobacteriaceae bacterium MAR_2010_188]
MKFQKTIKLIFCLIVVQTASAQFTPPFKNYNLSNLNAGNQNWDVSRSDEGELYFANHKGLLEYDGLRWKLLQIPNKTTLRSVLAHKNRVYIGSYEEFGFWERDSKGILKYFSLSEGMSDKISSDEEIWQIIAFSDKIVFRSFRNLYIYDSSGKIVKKTPNSVVISCSVVNNRLLVATLTHGIYELTDSDYIEYYNSPELNGIKIISIIEKNDQLYLTTALNGSFYLSEKLTPDKSEINELIKQHQLNDFSTLENGNMIFGTIKNGVYVTDPKGKVLYNINKENGLANNTILSQFLDVDNRLWLGLDNGISSIDLENKVSFYNDVSGRLGAVYDVIKYQNTFYIGSNTGLFYLDTNGELQFIEGSQGQVWSLDELDDQLLCGHNNGTFLVKNKSLEPISNYTGGWTIKKVVDSPDRYVQGTYAGLIGFKNDGDNWQSKYLGKTTMPLKHIALEDDQTIWAAHTYKGIYKIKIEDSWDSIKSISDYGNTGIGSDYNVRVYKLKNAICFKTNEGWKKYEPLLDSIVSHDYLNKTLGKDSYIISEEFDENFVLKTSDDAISFRNFNKQEYFIIGSDFFDDRLIVGYENVSSIGDSLYALNLNDGFALIDKNLKIENSLSVPILQNIQINREYLKLGSQEEINLHFNDNLRLVLNSPKSFNYFLEYLLSESDDSKWTKVEGNEIYLTNLSAGQNNLKVRSNNQLGKYSEAKSILLTVSPPWYQDTAGYLLYLLVAIMLVLLFYFLHKRKIEKEQGLLKTALEEEQKEILNQKTLENEKRIVNLKNEALKNEVQLKSKQLANTAMALVRKNETLLEIKQDLVENKKGFDNFYSYKKLIKRVDNSISHKDEWEIFENNFNQVHEEFFEEIKLKHPNLNHKDLKVCAYIKMNLSSKEIAPLMNISVRGVETYRYRLKKKLDLENDISMSDYLINFE